MALKTITNTTTTKKKLLKPTLMPHRDGLCIFPVVSFCGPPFWLSSTDDANANPLDSTLICWHWCDISLACRSCFKQHCSSDTLTWRGQLIFRGEKKNTEKFLAQLFLVQLVTACITCAHWDGYIEQLFGLTEHFLSIYPEQNPDPQKI